MALRFQQGEVKPLIRKAPRVISGIDRISIGELGVVIEMAPIDPHTFQGTDVIREWLRLDIRDRQLAVLRNTYPAWNIDLVQDVAGAACWVATLCCELTPALVRAGVFKTIRQSDAIALAATLAWQSSLLRCGER
ncbi:hypothetical protein ACFOY2_06465 [Nonomuraea purpurea]|uniref:Uncharacterized protein n=1 Tax=Nonomuraea purpurea TaxID=1849276 RepID=A0ABV8G1H0_9ACTN